jgi:hypothetical protein
LPDQVSERDEHVRGRRAGLERRLVFRLGFGGLLLRLGGLPPELVRAGGPGGQGEQALVLGLREDAGGDAEEVERVGAGGIDLEGLPEARVRRVEPAPRRLRAREDDPGLDVAGLRPQALGGEGGRLGDIPAIERPGVVGEREGPGTAGNRRRCGGLHQQEQDGGKNGHAVASGRASAWQMRPPAASGGHLSHLSHRPPKKSR